MSGGDGVVREFWRRVEACLLPGDSVALLPHTAALVITEAQSGEEREAARRAYERMMHAAVEQADRRLAADLARRGYQAVDFEAVRSAALDLGLGETDWSEPEAAMLIGRAVGADLVLAGDFRFEVRLLPGRGGGAPDVRPNQAPAAHQEVRYLLVALDAAHGTEVARSPLTHSWESILPAAGEADRQSSSADGSERRDGEE